MTVQSTRRGVLAAGGAALVSGCTAFGDPEPIHVELASESEYLADVDYANELVAYVFPIKGFDILLEENPPRTPEFILLFRNNEQEYVEQLATGQLQARVNGGAFDPNADYEIGVVVGGDAAHQIGGSAHSGGQLLERIPLEITQGVGGDGQ